MQDYYLVFYSDDRNRKSDQISQKGESHQDAALNPVLVGKGGAAEYDWVDVWLANGDGSDKQTFQCARMS